MKAIRIGNSLLLKHLINFSMMVETLSNILLEYFLDLVRANLDHRPINTVVVSVLLTSQKRVAYRLIVANSGDARCTSRLANPASTPDIRIICTKKSILFLAFTTSWVESLMTVHGVIITSSIVEPTAI